MHSGKGICPNCGENHEELQKKLDAFLKELVEALNKGLASGMPPEAINFVMVDLQRHLQNMPNGVEGRITILAPDGRVVAGEVPSKESQIIDLKTGEVASLEELLPRRQFH